MRTCSVKSTSVTVAARWAIGEMGETVAPAKAPETTAPAVRGRGKPMLWPMTAKATPTLLTVPHVVPMATLTRALKRKAATRKTLGHRTLSP